MKWARCVLGARPCQWTRGGTCRLPLPRCSGEGKGREGGGLCNMDTQGYCRQSIKHGTVFVMCCGGCLCADFEMIVGWGSMPQSMQQAVCLGVCWMAEAAVMSDRNDLHPSTQAHNSIHSTQIDTQLDAYISCKQCPNSQAALWKEGGQGLIYTLQPWITPKP